MPTAGSTARLGLGGGRRGNRNYRGDGKHENILGGCNVQPLRRRLLNVDY